MTKEENPQPENGISLFLGKRKPRASLIPPARPSAAAFASRPNQATTTVAVLATVPTYSNRFLGGGNKLTEPHGVMVKTKELEVEQLQPECGTASPGAGFVTDTFAVPAFAMSLAETEA